MLRSFIHAAQSLTLSHRDRCLFLARFGVNLQSPCVLRIFSPSLLSLVGRGKGHDAPQFILYQHISSCPTSHVQDIASHLSQHSLPLFFFAPLLLRMPNICIHKAA